jgi:hypothetical protein
VSDELLRALAARLEDLGVRGAWRRRVLAEARDHLEQGAREGDEAALERFGDVDLTARMVAAEVATVTTRSATYAAFGALALAGLAFVGLLALIPVAGGWPDLVAGKVGAVGPVLGLALLVLPQVAFVSGSLALIRALRLRRDRVAGSAELELLRRRGSVALAACGAALLALAISAVDLSGVLAGWWTWTTVAACALLVFPIGAARMRLASSARPVAPAGGTPGDIFDDLAPLLALAPIRRLELPEHPWRFAALCAAGVGLAAFAAGWVAEGDPASGIVRGGFEALALLGCFALLGRTLGLRQAKR